MKERRRDDIEVLVHTLSVNGHLFRDAILREVRARLPPGQLAPLSADLGPALDRLLPAVFDSLRTGERLDENELYALRGTAESWARRGVPLRVVAGVAVAAGDAAREMTKELSTGPHLALIVSFGHGVRIAQEAMTALAVGHAHGALARRAAQWHRTSEADSSAAAAASNPAPRQPVDVLPQLSPPSEQVLRMVAQGRTNAEIAEELHLSRQAVNYQVGRMMRSAGVTNRTALVARAYETGRLRPAG